MKKPMIFYILFAIVVILGIVLYFFLRYSKPSEITGYHDFSCPTMSGHVFQYPVFKGLENISIPQENFCELRIKETNGDRTIFIIKITPNENNTTNLNQTNPYGISYTRNSDINEYIVKLNSRSNNKIISIRIDVLPIRQTENIRMMLGEYSKNIIDSLKMDPNPFAGEAFSLKLGETIQLGNFKITHIEVLDQVKLEANSKTQIITLENSKPIEFQGYTITKIPRMRSQPVVWLRVTLP